VVANRAAVAASLAQEREDGKRIKEGERAT
jgi:hypothetical protein